MSVPPAFDSFPDIFAGGSNGGSDRDAQQPSLPSRRRDDTEKRKRRLDKERRDRGRWSRDKNSQTDVASNESVRRGQSVSLTYRDREKEERRLGDKRSREDDAGRRTKDIDRDRHRERDIKRYNDVDQQTSTWTSTKKDAYEQFEETIEKYPSKPISSKQESTTTSNVDFRPPKLIPDDKRLFYTSSFPDNGNLVLEGPELSVIPRYRRFGQGRVLGLPRDIRISEKVQYRTRNVVLPSSYSLKSLRSSKTRMPERESNVRRIVASKTGLKTDEDFVPLVSHRRKAKQREAHQRGLLTLDVDYRGVQGSSKPSDIDEDVHNSSSEETSDEEDSSKAIYNNTVKRRVEWDKHLKEFPQDVQAWLDYVDFQNDVVTNEHNGHNKRTIQSVVSDLQYQVLDKALSHQPRNLDLVVKKLECGAKGSREGMAKEFRVAIYNHKGQPGVYRIWKAYIDYVQCHASIIVPGDVFPNDYDEMCSFEIVSRVYEMAFRDLNNLATESNLVELFFRYCSFLLSAGYTERVYSLYQAMFEVNFKGIELNKLGELWYDHKYRRVGDEHADDEDENIYKLEYPKYPTFQLQEWHEYETINDDINNSFSVVGEQNNSDDPFRNVILEVDLLPFLFILQDFSSKMRLIDSLLNVFGIGVALGGLSTNDGLLHDSLLQRCCHHKEVLELGGVSYFNQPQYVNTLFPFSDSLTSIKNEHSEYLQRILDDLGILHLQMLLHKNENRKLKQLLAVNPDEKYLYDIYARLQFEKGKLESARKVYSECLKSTSDDEINRVKFCYSWSLMEFLQGDRKAALNVLCDGIISALVDDRELGATPCIRFSDEDSEVKKEQSTISLLKARKLWSSHISSTAFEVVSCRALFEYLISSSLDKTVSIYEESLEKLVNPSYDHEVLTSELVHFVDVVEKLHDADRSVQLPSTSTIKRILEGAIRSYPHNAFFSYLNYNAKTKLDGYRQLFDEEVAENSHSGIYIQKVKNIVKRSRVSNVPFLNQVRRVFAMGTISQNAQHSEALWNLYFDFECHVAKDYKSAEKVIISSLRYCPWSKKLHMLLFDLADNTDVDNHLLQVLTLMDKYGIRLRVDASPYIRRAVEFEISKEEVNPGNLEHPSENSDEEMFI